MSCHRLRRARALRAGRAAAGARAFQRVKAEEWLGHKAARDNSYQATFGGGGWGAGAQEVLGKARRARPCAWLRLACPHTPACLGWLCFHVTGAPWSLQAPQS